MEARPTKLNPLRSRHASQGTLVLSEASRPSKIAVAAARPAAITTVTPFSSNTTIAPESEDLVHTGGTFLSINTVSPIPESARSFRRGSAPDAMHSVSRNSEGSPKAANWRNNLSFRRNAGDDDMTVEDAEAIPKERPLTLTKKQSMPPNEVDQYSRTQNQVQHHQRQGPELPGDRSAAPALRSTGLAYDDYIETEAVEDLCLLLGLSRKDIRQLRRQFNDEDGDNTWVAFPFWSSIVYLAHN